MISSMHWTIFLLHSLFSQTAFDSRSPSCLGGGSPPSFGDFKFMQSLIYRMKLCEKCKLEIRNHWNISKSISQQV